MVVEANKHSKSAASRSDDDHTYAMPENGKFGLTHQASFANEMAFQYSEPKDTSDAQPMDSGYRPKQIDPEGTSQPYEGANF